jgi:hypothetical protein
MTYKRVIARNDLSGDGYDVPTFVEGSTIASVKSILRGDLRRLESDQWDERHLQEYAAKTGLTPGQVKVVLDAFFGS